MGRVKARDNDMDETTVEADFLKGKQVAFTGKLASMARTEAAELVRDFGGRFVPQVNRQTSFLIVGHEGWPLRKDGRLTRGKQSGSRLLRLPPGRGCQDALPTRESRGRRQADSAESQSNATVERGH
jgi:BRCA1 C Terminus (BRCT) domain